MGIDASTIRVALADDHAVVRDGIRSIIEKRGDAIRVVAEASDGEEILRIAEEKPVDVYLLDIAMPRLSGIDTIERLIKIQPHARIIILSMYQDKILVERAFANGARGYLLKESATGEIIAAIREVHQGRYYLSPRISGFLVEGFLNPKNQDGEKLDAELTNRQRQVLQLIADGMTEKEIAGELNISANTVHVHKNTIMKKLGVHTTAALVKQAIKMGITQL